jgi:hypothetical protein
MVLVPACEHANADIPPDIEEGYFSPVVALDDGISYEYARGRYQRVGHRVHVDIEIAFRNSDPTRESTGIRIVPPFTPDPEPFLYGGHISAVRSSYLSPACQSSPEFVVQAQSQAQPASIIVQCDPSGRGGGSTLLYGLNEDRILVGTISYDTTGEFLY